MILPPQLMAAKAVLQGLPWKLIGYAVAALVVVVFAWRVHVWHQAYLREESTQKELTLVKAELAKEKDSALAAAMAYSEAVSKARATEQQSEKISQQVEHDLQDKLVASDSYGRTLARRLRDYESGRSGGSVPATPGSPADPASTGAVTGSDAEIGRATEEVFAACKSDAERLDAWNTWYDSVRESWGK